MRREPKLSLPLDATGEIAKAPRLPAEVLREILAWAVKPNVRQDNSTAVEQDGPFVSESSPIYYPSYSIVSNLALTSTSFRSIVKEFCSVRIVIRSARENRQYLQFFTEYMEIDSLRLPGSRTSSIEVRLPDHYDAELLAAVFQYTPNLTTFVFSTQSDVVAQIPQILVKSLSTQAPQLQHLYIGSISNSLTFHDVLALLKSLKSIHTLHIQHICSYPDLAAFMSTPQPTPWTTSLNTLSLGVLEDSQAVPDPRSSVRCSWDRLVTMLTHSDIGMPSLQELIIPMFPSTPVFFSLYGTQIKTLHTTSFYSQKVLAPALTLCASVETLSIELCDEIPRFPDIVPCLKEFHIFPCMEGVCGSAAANGYHSCPIKLHELLEEVFSASCPVLAVVSIHTIGAFRNLATRRAFVCKWRDKWNSRGVRFTDGLGNDMAT